jgi:hypothetical protein
MILKKKGPHIDERMRRREIKAKITFLGDSINKLVTEKAEKLFYFTILQ